MSAWGRRVPGAFAGVSYAVLTIALALIATQGLLFAIAAAALAVLLIAVTVAGPTAIGIGALLMAMLTAPMDALRPPVPLITVSDLAFALAFALLFPHLLRNRAQVPPLFLVGVMIIVVSTLLTSLLSDDLVGSLAIFARFLAAGIILPLLFAFLAPSGRLLDAMAWAYVAGQVISTLYGIPRGTHQGRYFGLTQHYNFLGLGAVVAAALCLYLLSRTPPRYHWIIWGAGAIVVASAVMSGSRAALLAIVILAVVYPVLERSLLSAYLVVGGAVVFALSLNWLIAILGPGSALARILPDDYGASLSSLARQMEQEVAWADFLQRPLLGYGWDLDQFWIHNVFLQILVAVGLVGLIGFAVLGWSLLSPLFTNSPRRALGYVALAYAATAPFTPSMWDRNIWAGLALAIVAGTAAARGDVTDDGTDGADGADEQQPAEPDEVSATRIKETTR